MNNYVESKKTLDKIRRKDEVMFRMAISHLMDVGIRHLTEENILAACSSIVKRDDSKAFMTNAYMCDLVVMAGDIAKVPHTDLLVYIQREVDYDVFDGGMSYSRLMRLLKSCLNWIEEDNLDTLDTFEYIGLDEDEIETLGYGYLITKEDENNEDIT
jgi:hypothetical protein